MTKFTIYSQKINNFLTQFNYWLFKNFWSLLWQYCNKI